MQSSLLILSYLSNRDCVVNVNNVFSEKYNISWGVPQGSILGPLLFLLYINDIQKFILNGTALLYADDTTLIFSHKDPSILQSLVNHDLNNVIEYTNANHLKLNGKKSKFMFFSPYRNDHQNISISASIENDLVERVNQFKFLGFIIDIHFSWKSHIDHIVNKLNSCLCIVLKTRAFL